MIELPAGVHLSAEEVHTLLAILDAACRAATPDARAANVIRQLRKTDERLTRTTEKRQSGVQNRPEPGQHAAYDLCDSAEAAAILGITPGGVRYLRTAGRIPAHRAGGRWLYPTAPLEQFAARKAARRAG